MNNTIALFLILLYNSAIIAGTSYLIFWKGQSWWLFFVGLLFMANGKWKSKDRCPKCGYYGEME